MKGLKILIKETQEFVEKGPELNIVNPQSSAEDGYNGKYLTIEGEKKLDLTRLDYLALGSDPAIREIMIDCIKKYDIGCPASQMVVRTDPTLRLERTLAEWHCQIFSVNSHQGSILKGFQWFSYAATLLMFLDTRILARIAFASLVMLTPFHFNSLSCQ
jgi:hypothetical protein